MMAIPALLRRRLPSLLVLATSALLTNCSLDELLSPTALGTLSIAPMGLVDSARVGSTAPRTTTVALTITGTIPTLKFGVTAELQSPWITGGLGVGTAPNDLTITLDPTGLAVGEYSDTLRFTNDGPDARLVRVPVTLKILPCSITNLPSLTSTGANTLVASTSSALTAEDCAATGTTDRFAKRFRFEGTAGDSITARVGPSAFAARVTLRREGAATTLSTSEACPSFGTGACVRYVSLPESGNYEVEVTSAAPRITGTFDLSVSRPRLPDAPSALSQRSATDINAIIAAGSTLGTDRIALQAALSDPDSDSLRLEIELRPLTTPLSNVATNTTATTRNPIIATTVTGLLDNTQYRWQARTVDQTGRASAWVPFGSGTADFAIGVPEAPNAPTLLVQRKVDGVTPVAVGGATNESIILLGATVTDADPGDQIRLELEVRTLGTPFTNVATQSSAPNPSGTAVLTTVAGLVDNGQYRWQARAVDQSGRTSAWVSPGGAGAHFRTAIPPSALAYLQEPTTAAAGAALTPALRVAVQDANGNTLASYTGPVTIALATNPSGATLSGTTTVSAVAGIASFTDLSLNKVGVGYTLRATVGSLEATSAAFAITPSAANRMELGAVPSTVVAGTTFAPALQVTVRDALGNVATGFTGNITLALAPNAADAVLLGTTTVSAVSGVATFGDVRIARAATNLTLLVTATGLANVTSTPITVTPAAASVLRVVTAPSATAASGVPFTVQPALELDDVFGNPITTAGATVTATLASGPGGSSLLNATATTDATGRATFTGLAIVGPAGNYTLTFSAASLTSTPTGTITMGAGVATKLSLRTPPSPTVVNGESFVAPPRVLVRDAADNNVLQSGVPVTVSIATGGGTLLGTTTVLTNTTGDATFSDLGLLGTVGARTLAFSAPGLTGVTTDVVTLTPGAATTLALDAGNGQSAAAATAVAIAPSVVARDVSGNTVAGVTVTFAVTSGGGSISPTTPVTTGANGIAALTSWTLGGSAGTNTLSASATDLAGSPVAFTATATAGAASQMTILGGNNLTGPVGTTLATPHEVRITDATGNPVAGVTVTWSATGGGSVAPSTSITNANGLASTTRTLGPTSGAQTTVASATLAGGPTSVTFTVTATVGGATQLALVTGDAQVDSVGATLPTPLTVVVRDALNNPVPGVLVSWSVLAGGGSVSPSSTPTNASGIATTNWTLGTVRTPTDSTQIARASGVGTPVTFVALARAGAVNATQTAVVISPTSITASRSTPATVTVTARDGFGNPVAGVPVTLSATSTGNTITQPVAVTNASGVATGSIGATVTGVRTIRATVNGVLANSAPTLTVAAAPAAALLFVTSPSDGVAGEDLALAPVVGAVDSLGNRNPLFTGTVTLGIGNNAGAGSLSGATSRSVVAGVATFPGIAIEKAGSGYTLIASSTGLTSATSGAFSLSAGAVNATQSSISASAASIVAGTETSTLTVTARDANGNPVSGATVVLAATGSGNTLTQPLGVTNASGVATGTLSATTTGARTISATVNGVALTATSSVTVVPGAVSPTLSIITGIPTTLVAGVEVSAVTVTARDGLGNAVPGATVVLAATGSNNTIVQPAGVTNASGVATGSFGSTVAESKTLSATINGVALSSTVTVGVTPGAISAARSLVAAAPTSLVAGSGTSTITVTARDANDNVIAGANVVLAATGAGNTLVQPTGPTDALGIAAGSISSSASGSKTITATIGGIAITQTATVNVTAGSLSTTQSTLESDLSSVAAGDSVTLTVTARDANGNPISGLAVVIAATGDGNTITQPASVTNANGVATGRVLSTVAQTKTITATVNDQALVQSAVVTFTPAAVSGTASTVTIAPTTIAADGSNATITVTVRDRFANAISGASVMLAASGTGNALTQPASVTDANGVATGSISATMVGTKLISATVGALALADTVSLTVTPGSISAAQSSVSIDPTVLTAGAESATITVTARDGNGNLVPGATVVLAATGSGNTLTQPALVTGANGVATGSIASTGAGTKTISATVGGVLVTQTVSLTVTPAAISETTSTLTASTSTVTAGTGSSTITVTARDAFGNAVAGATVVLSATGTGNTLTQPASVTNALGVATGSFASSTSEAKTISATAGGVALAQSVAITVVPDVASPITSTVTISSSTLVAGSDTATVTVTARDGSGNVVPGVTIVLESVSPGLVLLQPAAVTDGNGVSIGRVVGTLAGAKTITATLNGVAVNATAGVTVTPAGVSADSSSVLANPSTLQAGAIASEIVVTARDAFGNLIANATVVLTATGTDNTLTQPTNATDANGRTSGTFTSTAVGAKIISATINGVALLATDTITVSPAAVSGAQSSIALSASSITAGGAAGTITVNARDAFGNAISGATVVLDATGTSNTLTQPAALTDATGQATGTIASTIAGDRIISASINGTPVSTPQTLTVNAAAVSATQSTLGSDPASIVAGIGTSTIIVRARDQFGNNVAGASVALIANGRSNTLTQPEGVTDADGLATGTLTSTVAESKSITAIVNGVTLASGLQITVTPGTVSAANSGLSVSPSSLTAGAGSSIITVTARDANNNVIPGATVALAATGATGTLTQPTDVTTAAGVATGAFAANTVGVRTISATVNGVAINATANITVSAAPFSAAQTTIGLSPTSIVAGASGTTVTVTVRDAFDNAISGATVLVAATGTGSSITQPVATTDANGVTTATITSTVAEPKTISATVNGNAVTQTAALTVTPGAVTAAQSTVVASTSSITAGSGTSTITVTARDAFGNAVAGVSVTLESAAADVTVTQPVALTDANGETTGSVTGTIVGTKTIVARLNGVAALATVDVAVTPAVPSTSLSTASATPTSISAGSGTSAISVTVRDAFGNLVPNATVEFSATGTGNSLPSSASTDVNGVATVNLSSTVVGTKVVTVSLATGNLPSTLSIMVVPGAALPGKSTVATSATSITTDGSATITVQLRDENENLLTSSSGTVVLSTTLGTLTAVTPVGNGTYVAVLTSAAVGTATVSGSLDGEALANSVDVQVAVGVPTQLVFTTQPSASSVAGEAFAQQPVVEIRDAAGNTVTTSSASVSLALTSGTGTLSGIATVAASSGAAAFSGLSINTAGTGKVLTASSSGLSSATSLAFTVTALAPTGLSFDPAAISGTFGVGGSSTAPTLLSNGGAAVTYTLTSPAQLPAGLSIDASTGVVSWTSELAAGVYEIQVTATNTAGSVTTGLQLSVAQASSAVTVTGTTAFTFTGSAQGPTTAEVTGSTGAVTFSYAGTGATIYGPSATPPAAAGSYAATATVAADANFTGATSAPLAFTIAPKAASTLTLAPIADQTFTGSASTPPLTVTDGATALVLNTDYTVAYTNNTTVGTATVTVTGIGNYAGDTTVTFEIISEVPITATFLASLDAKSVVLEAIEFSPSQWPNVALGTGIADRALASDRTARLFTGVHGNEDDGRKVLVTGARTHPRTLPVSSSGY